MRGASPGEPVVPAGTDYNPRDASPRGDGGRTMRDPERANLGMPRRPSPGRGALVCGAVLAGGLVLATGDADARMYQWVNPSTGHAQMSGTPPSWYRSGQKGPRVLVWENGMLVDDTSLRVSEERTATLRQHAFDEAKRRKELAALQRLEESARREAAKAERKLQTAAKEGQGPGGPEADANAEPVPGSLEKFGADTIERLKSIIAEFDRLGEGQPSTPAAPQ